jgi:hypothetical protein
MGPVEVAGSRAGHLRSAKALPWTGRTDSGPNWSKAKQRSG